MAVDTKPTIPSVEEAERVIAHLLSYPDECEETLDAVRYIMQWMDAALARHARILRQPLPEGIRADIEHVPSKRHRTSIIVKGVLEGYLKWLRKNHPETGDDVDPDAGPIIHKSHHVLVQEHLGGVPERMHICVYCGKVEGALVDPCPEAERMNREEDEIKADLLLKYQQALDHFPSLKRSHGPESLAPIEEWYRQYIFPLREEESRHG